eukprot:TRINITY_DN1027_c0_g1_i13.p1 TRINITY_DN1027_c0_g1~~TRINITY_DN1027_c0_g1_i13.p1  ORF type:complete len:553 (-),score=212.61 TRINITY_DN1027_c0_g1_i13:761-2197(-)
MNKQNSKLLGDLTNMNKTQSQSKTRAQLLRQKLMNAKLNLGGEGGDEQMQSALMELNKLMEEQDNISSALELAEKQGTSTKEVTNVLSESNQEVADLLQSLKESQGLNNELQNKYDELSKQLHALTLKMPLYLQPGSNSVPPPTGTVTLVFTDVKGSTVQWEKDPETMAPAISIHNKIMRKKLEDYQGYEVKTEGDAFMVAFAECINAVKWCLDLQMTLMNEEWPEQLLKNEESAIEYDSKKRMIYRGLKVRMGINKGEPSAEPDPVTGRMDYFGQMVNQSARVEGIADGGQILISGTVWEEVEPKLKELGDPIHKDLGTHRMKGLNRDTHIFQLMPNELEERKFPEIGVGAQEEKSKDLKSQLENLNKQNDQLMDRLNKMDQTSSEALNQAMQLKQVLLSAQLDGSNEQIKGALEEINKLIEGQSKFSQELSGIRKSGNSSKQLGQVLDDSGNQVIELLDAIKQRDHTNRELQKSNP